MDMPDEKTDWPEVGQVCHSLRRSRTRRMLYKTLCDIYPRKMSLKELSALTWIRQEDVLGAITGHCDRFSADDSLTSMGLAIYEEEMIYGEFVKIFQATKRGIDMRPKLREHRYSSESKKSRMSDPNVKINVRMRKARR